MRLERGHLLAALAGALVAAALVLVVLHPWRSSNSAAPSTTKTAPARTTPNSNFGVLFHPATPARRQRLQDAYWLGPKLGPYPALLKHSLGDVERGVFAYTDPGDPNRPHVLVRVLDAKPFPGHIPSAGSTLLSALNDSPKRFRTRLGPAALTRDNQAVVRPDRRTVIEIDRLDDPDGAVPSLRQLVLALRPVS